MKPYENLLIIAMEECAEVAKECSEMQQEIAKALRFGLENHHPIEPNITNRERILKEYYQLQAVMERLMNETCLGDLSQEEIKEIKSDKLTNVMKFGKLSKELGLVD